MFSRRPGFRFNRGRVAVGPVAPGGGGGVVIPELDATNLRWRLDADSAATLAHTGDGTAVTAANDLVAMAPITTGPTYYSLGWGRTEGGVAGVSPAIRFSATGQLITTDASLLSVVSGGTHDLTVMMLWCPAHINTFNTYWSFGSAATYHVLGTGAQTNVQALRMRVRGVGDASKNLNGTLASEYQRVPQNQITVWRVSSGVGSIITDGLSDTLDSTDATWLSFTTTFAGIGTGITTSNVASAPFYLKWFGFFDAALSGTQLDNNLKYLAYRGRLPKCGWTLREMEAAA